jgi:hypothetical protein
MKPDSIRWIKWVIVLFILFFGIMSIKLYVNNYLVIQSNITDTKVKIARLWEHAAYLQNFRNAYLKTELAVIFKSHQSGIPYKNWHIYKFEYSAIQWINNKPVESTWNLVENIPREWRDNYIKFKWYINNK